MKRRRARIAVALAVGVCWLLGGGATTVWLGEHRLQRTLYGPAETFASALLDAWAADPGYDSISRALGATTGWDPDGAQPVPQGGPHALPLIDPNALLFQYGSPAYVLNGPGGEHEASTGMRVTQTWPQVPRPSQAGVNRYRVEVPGDAFFDQGSSGTTTELVCAARDVAGVGLTQVCVLLDPRIERARAWDAMAPIGGLILAATFLLGCALVIGACVVGGVDVRHRLRVGGRRHRRRLLICGAAALVGASLAAGLGFGSVRAGWEYAVVEAGARTLTNTAGFRNADELTMTQLVPPFGARNSLLWAGDDVLFVRIDRDGRVHSGNAPAEIGAQLVPPTFFTNGDRPDERGLHAFVTWNAVYRQVVTWPGTGRRITALCFFDGSVVPVLGQAGSANPDGSWTCVFIDPAYARSATARAVGQLASLAGLGGLAGGLLAWLVVALAVTPLARVRRLALDASRSDDPQLLPRTGSGDEADQVAGVINVTIERLQHSLEAQRRFVADAAHELRSPVATLVNTVEVAERYPSLVDRDEVDATVLRQAYRIEALTQDLLLLAGMDAKAPLRRDPVDLGEVVAGVVAARETLRVPVHHTPGVLPPVLGDAAAFDRIVGNLLDNAVRHAATEVRLGLDATSSVARVSVHNDGAPIPLADQERIFDRFTRLDDARDRDAGGTGLGLAIARETARRYGGDVTVRSSVDEATTFTLVLPRPR